LKPFISYLVSVPFDQGCFKVEKRVKLEETLLKDSPNYISLDNFYDWAILNKQIRIFGEDSPISETTFSKEEKCLALCNLVYEMYPFIKQN
jgi:hypothetical protein